MLILQISGSSAICFLIMLAYSIKNDSEESFLSCSSRCAGANTSKNVDIRTCLYHIGEITGEISNEDQLD